MPDDVYSEKTDHSEPRSSLPPSRRDTLKQGVKLAWIAPAVYTFSAAEAYAAGSQASGFPSGCLPAGELCTSDSDCCSSTCMFGLCQ